MRKPPPGEDFLEPSNGEAFECLLLVSE
jgi:hypothetical protein